MEEAELSSALSAARAGDESGFAQLWRALQPAVHRYLRVIVGDDAEDIASEAWLQVARDIRRFEGDPVAFRKWLFRIVRNRAMDHLRKIRRRPPETDQPVPDARLATPDAADETMRGLATEWALNVIATLPQHQAEVIVLRVVAGLDVAQTAAVLGRRRGAVRTAAMRGLRRLAEHPEVKARQSAGDARSADPAAFSDLAWPSDGVTP